jgi:hypothetical protein
MPPEPAATDVPETPVSTFAERRREPRFQVPPCATCGYGNTHVATRTPYFLYIRCRSCVKSGACPWWGMIEHSANAVAMVQTKSIMRVTAQVGMVISPQP